METAQDICTTCGGSGAKPDGWTLDQAKANPEGFNDYKLAGSRMIMLTGRNRVNENHFLADGRERCRECHGTGESQAAQARRIKAKREAAAAKAHEEAERVVKEYPHLEQVAPGGWANQVLAAKNIRTELKRAFPGQKFSVRSESFSMGDSIHIKWMDGPTVKDVESITRKYQQGYFDGMTDCYEYKTGPFNRVFGGSKYVQTERTHSNDTYLAAIKEAGHADTFTITDRGEVATLPGINRFDMDVEAKRREVWQYWSNKSYYIPHRRRQLKKTATNFN